LVDDDEARSKALQLELARGNGHEGKPNKAASLTLKGGGASSSQATSSQTYGHPGSDKKSKSIDLDKIQGGRLKELEGSKCLMGLRNYYGKSVIHFAVENGSVRVSEWLLTEKIGYLQLSDNTNTNMNALTYACKGR